MKKLFISGLIVLFMCSAASSQFRKLGGGLGFTTGFPFHEMSWDANKSGKFDISLKGIYVVKENIHISPSITYFIPHITKETNLKTVVSTTMIDINGHYIFKSADKFDFYGLAGIDLLFAGKKETPEGSSSSKERDTSIGLNLGAGTYMKFSEKADIYIEAKYVACKYGQFMINAGLLFDLNLKSAN